MAVNVISCRFKNRFGVIVFRNNFITIKRLIKLEHIHPFRFKIIIELCV